MESGAAGGGGGDVHTICIDPIGYRLNIDGSDWIKLSETRAKLVARLLEDPLGPRTKEDLTKAVHGRVIPKDGSINDLFRHIKDQIAQLRPNEECVEDLVFWENIPRVGYALKPGWKVARWLPDPVSDILTEHLNRSLAEIYWLIRERPDIDIYSIYGTLKHLATVCQLLIQPDRLNEARWNWINFIVRIAVYLNEHGHPLDKQEFSTLASRFEEIYRRWCSDLWVSEWRALYLELVEDFAGAGQASEIVITHALSSDPKHLIAALYSRAAQCYERANDPLRAADLFVKAAVGFAHAGRVSARALECYQRAVVLDPESLTGQIETEMVRLSRSLAEIRRTHRATIAIVSNRFDVDLADFLVDPLSRRGILCCLQDSAGVADLAELYAYDAIIVVGSIKARDTDYHVHKYFYNTKSQQSGVTFQEVDIHARHHCDTWPAEIAGRPVYVLAGLSRQETCRAVLNFVDSDELRELEETIGGEYWVKEMSSA